MNGHNHFSPETLELIGLALVAKSRSAGDQRRVNEIIERIRAAVDEQATALQGSHDETIRDELLARFLTSEDGQALLDELQRITAPAPRAVVKVEKGTPEAAALVGARIRKDVLTEERVVKARDDRTSLRDACNDESEAEYRTKKVADLLADDARLHAEVLQTPKGTALFKMADVPYSDLPFDKAVAEIEQRWPGWLDEMVDLATGAPFGDVGDADAWAELCRQAEDVRKANPEMSVEQARTRAMEIFPDLTRRVMQTRSDD